MSNPTNKYSYLDKRQQKVRIQETVQHTEQLVGEEKSPDVKFVSEFDLEQ